VHWGFKVTEPQQKGIRKGTVIALAILVVILGVSIVYVYTSLQNQINALSSDKTQYERKIQELFREIDELQPNATPDFEIFSVRISEENTTFKIKNTGGKNAHHINICIEVEFLPAAGLSAKIREDTTIELLWAGETKEGYVKIGKNNASGAYVNSIGFQISCRENVSKTIVVYQPNFEDPPTRINI